MATRRKPILREVLELHRSPKSILRTRNPNRPTGPRYRRKRQSTRPTRPSPALDAERGLLASQAAARSDHRIPKPPPIHRSNVQSPRTRWNGQRSRLQTRHAKFYQNRSSKPLLPLATRQIGLQTRPTQYRRNRMESPDHPADNATGCQTRSGFALRPTCFQNPKQCWTSRGPGPGSSPRRNTSNLVFPLRARRSVAFG